MPLSVTPLTGGREGCREFSKQGTSTGLVAFCQDQMLIRVRRPSASCVGSHRQSNVHFLPSGVSLNGTVPPDRGPGSVVLFLPSLLELFPHPRAVPVTGGACSGPGCTHSRQRTETPGQAPAGGQTCQERAGQSRDIQLEL